MLQWLHGKKIIFRESCFSKLTYVTRISGDDIQTEEGSGSIVQLFVTYLGGNVLLPPAGTTLGNKTRTDFL